MPTEALAPPATSPVRRCWLKPTPLRSRCAGIFLAGLLIVAVSACGSEGRTLRQPDSVYPAPNADAATPETNLVDDPGAPVAFQINSSAMLPGGEIPPPFLCSTGTVAPPLSWQGTPADAVELALIVWEQTDPPIYYWLVSGVDPSLTQIGSLEVPDGASEAITQGGQPGWVGPCTMEGVVKEIRFTIHALGQPTNLAEGAPTQDAVAAILERSIAEATFTATVTG